MRRQIARDMSVNKRKSYEKNNHIGTISSVGDGGRGINVNNMAGSQLKKLLSAMSYGLASSPPPGTVAYTMTLDGNNSKDAVIGVYDENQPKCDPGDSMLYSKGGAKVSCIGDKVYINGIDVLAQIEELKNEIEVLKNK